MLKPLTEEKRTEDSDVLLDTGKVLGRQKKRKDKVLSLRLKQTILDIFWLKWKELKANIISLEAKVDFKNLL